jgi:hypothetical protein
MSDHDYHGVFYHATAVAPDYVGIDAVVDAAKTDERAKCRAELLDVVAEVERIARDDYGSALDVLYDFTKEAFGGE